MLERWSRRVWAPEDGGGDGDGGGGGDKIPPTESQEPAWVKPFMASMNDLGLTMKELTDMAKAAKQQRESQPPPREPDVEEEDEDTPDLETLNRADYARYMMQQMLKAVNKSIVEPMNTRLNEITAITTRSNIQASVKEVAAAHKDFWDWRQEMITLANEHKGLPPDKLYTLARGENPDKAKDLDKKYNPPAKDGGGPIRFKGFGGLTPGGTSGTGNKSAKMNSKDAGDAAWDETVKALGGEPLFEE